ncbi:MAG: hypothetical protein GX481_08830 [Atopobium sp.]|jgi:hypothetical protein|nr:hypothetical protein [Atopobium sp.]
MVANVDQAVQQVYDLRSFVVGSDGSGVGLTKLSEQLLRGDAVRSVFLAPNGIVTDVYPSKDIDAILGTNLYDQSLPSNTRASRRVVPASSP